MIFKNLLRCKAAEGKRGAGQEKNIYTFDQSTLDRLRKELSG